MVKGKPYQCNSKLSKREQIMKQKILEPRMATVQLANLQDDPLETLPSFKKFNKNGLNLTLSTKRVPELDEETKECIFDLLKNNMEDVYEKSKFGWNDKNMLQEAFDEEAWYLLAHDSEGKCVGYSHFRFSMEVDNEVLYVHEIQIDSKYQRKGIGRFMMFALEMLAFKADMRKIMLTILKRNPEADKFFKQIMKFEIDETCPKSHVDYEILSKPNKRKIAKEAAEGVKKGGCQMSCC